MVEIMTSRDEERRISRKDVALLGLKGEEQSWNGQRSGRRGSEQRSRRVVPAQAPGPSGKMQGRAMAGAFSICRPHPPERLRFGRPAGAAGTGWGVGPALLLNAPQVSEEQGQ